MRMAYMWDTRIMALLWLQTILPVQRGSVCITSIEHGTFRGTQVSH
jgi:hypothetical protein